MTLVVDASVAAKWIMKEDHSERADALRVEKSLVAPSLISAELGNALWKAVRRGEFSEGDAGLSLTIALNLFTRLVPNEDLIERALEIAIELDHPIYDCFYLALAERERAPLVSADQRLLKAAKRLKGIELRAL